MVSCTRYIRFNHGHDNDKRRRGGLEKCAPKGMPLAADRENLVKLNALREFGYANQATHLHFCCWHL
jgi:hypothetical protein